MRDDNHTVKLIEDIFRNCFSAGVQFQFVPDFDKLKENI